jgi:hypothetical protein
MVVPPGTYYEDSAFITLSGINFFIFKYITTGAFVSAYTYGLFS